MTKTPTQEKLEAQRNKGMADILREALEGCRGQKHMVTIAAMDLGVTDATFYQWCREFGIDINEYRRVAPDAEQAAQETRGRALAEGDSRGGAT